MSAALQLIERPDTTELTTQAGGLVAAANALVITDDASFLAAVELQNACSALEREIVGKFLKPKRAADAAHAELCAWEKSELEPVKRAKGIANGTIATWRDQQEARTREERRKLEAEAKAREEDRRLAEAQEAQDAGEHELAEEIIAAPIALPPVRVAPATPKAQVSFRELWKYRIKDPTALIRHIAQHPEDLCYVTWNSVTIQRDVTSRKSAFVKPGIEVYNETSVATGRRG